MTRAKAKIVITGMGGLCSLGTSADAIWASMKAGKQGIGPITTVDVSETKVMAGAEIVELPDIGLDHRRLVTMDRMAHLAKS